MRRSIILLFLLYVLTFPAQAGAAELSPEEAVNAFLKTLDREQVLPLPPAASQAHSFLQPSLTQDQRTNLSLHPLTTGLSFLHPRTLTRSTDTVNSYLLTTTERQNQPTYVGYAQINKVAVTDLKRISENEYKAEFMLGYTVGPFGSLLFGRSVQFQRPQDALLDYQDNGWRIKFIKTF
jgi:hypothetical protein